jgi:glycine dehydrogenase subunit 1
VSQSPYLPNTDADRRAMLDKIGVATAEDLFRDIPSRYCHAAFDLPAPLSELELITELRRMSEQNAQIGAGASFLGGGYYQHFIPSVIGHLTGRSEFYTAYTPYQAEISQGTLQALYEFQSMVAVLTGMDVANAGMYDASTAAAEAALMASRITGREKIAVLNTVNPNYRDVIKTYAWGHDLDYRVCLHDAVPGDAAGIVLQQPDFYGCFNDIDPLIEKAHENGVLVVAIVNPIALGMYKAPGEYGADIAVAEGQPLGNAVNFGGPGVGLFAGRKDYLRQMPGRLVGRTLDADGRPGYVLTLSTREQHIRRERATSNICTSEAHVALAAAIYLALMGKTGLRTIAELCYQKAHYAAAEITRLKGYAMAFSRPFFNEFVIKCPASPEIINRALLTEGITGGLDISHIVPNGMLVCVTEMNTKDDIDRLVKGLTRLSGGAR